MSTVTSVVVRRLKGQRATIDVLPDDVLLEVFSFYVDTDHRLLYIRNEVYAWHKLVRVCQRWRQVVFASPRRLNLRLLCTRRTRMKKLLDIWPALPIAIEDYGTSNLTNINIALEHNDRVCKIALSPFSSPLLESVKERGPFPALTDLELRSCDLVLPDSFLDGSASRLRNLTLGRIPFPGLPKLLLSAHRLVRLCLLDIPDSGFISLEAMATGLSSLTYLRALELTFQSPPSHPHQTNRHPPPLTRTSLPFLTTLTFQVVSEYCEGILARIDFPLLNRANITFFDQPTFNTPQLRDLIGRTQGFKAFHRAVILFCSDYVLANLLRGDWAQEGLLRLGILCESSDRQLSSLAQLCNSSLPPFPTLEHLNICALRHNLHWQDDVEVTQWLEFLHPFIAVKSLYLDEILTPLVGPALQELAGERMAEVLPVLRDVFVKGPVQQAIAQFTAAQKLLGHLVAVQEWKGTWV